MFRALLAAAFLLSAPAFAHEFKGGDLTIGHPYSFEIPPRAQSAAGYFSVTNNGSVPDRLIAVRSEAADAMIHQSTEENGVAKMSHVEAVDIAPGETVTFGPGGYHIMFMGLEGKPWVAGDKVEAVLVFEKAGEVPVVFNVEPRKAGATDPHASH